VAAGACLAVAGASIAIAGHGAGSPAAAAALAAKSSTTTTQPGGGPPVPPPFPGAPGGRGRHLFGIGGAGTVSAVTSGGFTVKTRDGSSVTFTTSSSTVYREGPIAVGRSALAVGEHVLVGTTRPGASSGTSTSHAAQFVMLIVPEVGGKVVSVSGTTVVVQDGEGFWRTVQLSGSTVYQSAGTASTAGAVKAGVYIVAGGTIASDHTTLDASAVEILGTKPGDGPRSKIGRAFGFGGPAAFFGGPNASFPGALPAFPGAPAMFGGQGGQPGGGNAPA
jgi:hypothetical protein